MIRNGRKGLRMRCHQVGIITHQEVSITMFSFGPALGDAKIFEKSTVLLESFDKEFDTQKTMSSTVSQERNTSLRA